MTVSIGEEMTRRYLTVREAADLLGVIPQRVRAMLAQRPPQLEGVKHGRDWLIDRRSVEARLKRLGKRK